MIGNRLKIARGAAGLSLRELQAKIGNLVTAQAIGKYERNEAMPGSDVLVGLAQALDVSEDYLLDDENLVLEDVEFRKKDVSSKRHESQIRAKTLDLLGRYLAVEELLAMPSVNWNKPREAPYPVREMGDAESAARRLREAWGLGLDPIPDLFELLEEQGIKTLALDQDGIDGLSSRVRRPGHEPVPVIVVNQGDWGERQRFTLAHELGHLVMDVAPSLNEEKAAHRFAGAFLMPDEALWREIGKHRSSIGWGELFQFKVLFGVSVQALTYRCKDLGIFPDALFRGLFEEFKRQGWRDPPYKEPHALPSERPKRFERLCYRALAEDAISDSRAAELLGISVHILTQRMDSPPSVTNE